MVHCAPGAVRATSRPYALSVMLTDSVLPVALVATTAPGAVALAPHAARPRAP